jgi:hypothetical protein
MMKRLRRDAVKGEERGPPNISAGETGSGDSLPSFVSESEFGQIEMLRDAFSD